MHAEQLRFLPSGGGRGQLATKIFFELFVSCQTLPQVENVAYRLTVSYLLIILYQVVFIRRYSLYHILPTTNQGRLFNTLNTW